MAQGFQGREACKLDSTWGTGEQGHRVCTPCGRAGGQRISQFSWREGFLQRMENCKGRLGMELVVQMTRLSSLEIILQAIGIY